MPTKSKVSRKKPLRRTRPTTKQVLADLNKQSKLVTTKLQSLQVQQSKLFEDYVTGHVLPYIQAYYDETDTKSELFTDETREAIVSAVKYGVDMWRLQAHFANIQIMGQTAIGTPGCLQGPELRPWILQAPSVYNNTGYKKILVDAVADAVSYNFSQWQVFVTVPGLPWYPMFLAVAQPFAPPTPNIPMPLMVCVSNNFNQLASPSQLEVNIKSALPDSMKSVEADIFIYMLSVHLVNYFISWLSSQNVMMVIGMGPVPTFNPPYVPVGPVVNGYIIPSPGHLAV